MNDLDALCEDVHKANTQYDAYMEAATRKRIELNIAEHRLSEQSAIVQEAEQRLLKYLREKGNESKPVNELEERK